MPVCSLPWFFLVPTMGALHSKELPLPHIAKFKNMKLKHFQWRKPKVFFLGCNKLTQHLCSRSQVSSGSHSFYRKINIFSKEGRGEIHWSLYCGLNCIFFFFECFFFFFLNNRMEERELALPELSSSVYLCDLFLSCSSFLKCCHHRHDSRTTSHSFCCQSKTALRLCVERKLANVIKIVWNQITVESFSFVSHTSFCVQLCRRCSSFCSVFSAFLFPLWWRFFTVLIQFSQDLKKQQTHVKDGCMRISG